LFFDNPPELKLELQTIAERFPSAVLDLHHETSRSGRLVRSTTGLRKPWTGLPTNA